MQDYSARLRVKYSREGEALAMMTEEVRKEGGGCRTTKHVGCRVYKARSRVEYSREGEALAMMKEEVRKEEEGGCRVTKLVKEGNKGVHPVNVILSEYTRPPFSILL